MNCQYYNRFRSIESWLYFRRGCIPVIVIKHGSFKEERDNLGCFLCNWIGNNFDFRGIIWTILLRTYRWCYTLNIKALGSFVPGKKIAFLKPIFWPYGTKFQYFKVLPVAPKTSNKWGSPVQMLNMHWTTLPLLVYEIYSHENIKHTILFTN